MKDPQQSIRVAQRKYTDTVMHRNISYMSLPTKKRRMAVETTDQKIVKNSKPENRTVKFGDVQVWEFEPSLWTTSIPSSGIPIGCSNTLRKYLKVSLDLYEQEQVNTKFDRQRFMQEGHLSPELRQEMLHHLYPFSELEISERECQERRESREINNLTIYGSCEESQTFDEPEKEGEEDDTGLERGYYPSGTKPSNVGEHSKWKESDLWHYLESNDHLYQGIADLF